MTHVTLQRELNELEQDNILQAVLWVFSRNHKEYLDENFLLALHKRMFGDVWHWAGAYRRTNRNLGVKWWQVAHDVRVL